MSRYRWMLPLLVGALAAQAAEPPISPKVIERYRQMLERSPVEGTALDRLWKAYSDSGETAQLLAQYQADGATRFAPQMVFGYFLRKAARLDDAVAAFEHASKLDGKSPLPWLAQARVRLDQGRPGDAAACFGKSIALLAPNDPQRLEILMQLGAAWLAAGELARASEAWERTMELDPSNVELRRRLAESYVRNQLPDRALPHFEYLRKNAAPAGRAAALQEIARLHQGAGRQEEAIAALEEALAGTAPGNWLRSELQLQLIRLHQRYRRVPELEERWKKMARENPRDAGAYLRLIELYERLGELESERGWLEKLVVLAPGNSDYRIRLARLLVSMDDLAAAATLYDALLKEQPANAQLVFERARIDLLQGRLPTARDRITGLMKAHPSDELLREKALEFFSENRLDDLVEQQLKANAASDAEEPMLALARFYSARKRDAEARHVLEQFAARNEPVEADPAKRAAARARVAQVFKDQNDPKRAARELDEAIALQPESREYRLLMGDILSMTGERGKAREAFEHAYTLSRTAAEKREADQKLFEAVLGPVAPPQAITGRPETIRMRMAASTPQRVREVEDYLLALTRAATAVPSVEAWLRVARWQMWNRSARLAQECAERALLLDPDSIEAHEFMIKLAGNDSQTPLALRHLAELMRIHPAGRLEYERRIALLHLQSGAVEEALDALSRIVAANPGSMEALIDLAQTEQRAERWEAALLTWRQVHALAPASRKRETGGALLRVLERLGKDDEATRLLLSQIDAQTETREQINGFQELLAYCEKRRLLPWLRTEFEQRRKMRADDYFTGMALGRILKAQGDKAGAFDLFAEVSLAAPNQAEALPELVREAEELRRGAVAIRLQSQLVRVVPQTRPDGFEKLAQLQEKNFDIEEAARTWTRIVMRFPRDPAALEHAVDFELKWGIPTRATELLHRVCQIDPGNLKALFTLADLHADAGALVEARACLEEFLLRSQPEKPGDPLRFPKVGAAGRFQNGYLPPAWLLPNKTKSGLPRDRWIEEPVGKSELDWRLAVIRDLAMLVRESKDPGAMTNWVERWEKASLQSPGEALWALFYAGEHGPLFDLLARLMERSEFHLQTRQAFVWLTLHTRQFDRLASWLQDPKRTLAERDYLFGSGSGGSGGSGGMGGGGGYGGMGTGSGAPGHAGSVPGSWGAGSMGWAAASGGATGSLSGGAGLLGMCIGGLEGTEPLLFEKLFSKGYRLRRWQAAMHFANRTRFREAVQLGLPIFEASITQRADYGFEVAQWHIYLGDIGNARRLLADSMAQPGESLDAPVYHALRAFYLLLPPGERKEFTTRFFGGLDSSGQPLHATLCRLLLHGLAGDTEAAHETLEQLLSLAPLWPANENTPDDAVSRYWSFILGTGAQLQHWQLGSLAIFYWEKSLADEALVRLRQASQQPGQVHARLLEIRTRLAALRIARAESEPEVESIVKEYARYASVEGLGPLAESLETMGAYARGIAIYRQLWEQEPASAHALRNLAGACRMANDSETLVTVLERCVNERLYRMNDATHHDLTLQLVDTFLARGEPARALLLLEKGIAENASDSRLLTRLAQLHARAGRRDAAETIYRRLLAGEPINQPLRLALASLLEEENRFPEAIEILEKNTGPDSDARLAILYLKADKKEEAFAALERLPVAQKNATLLLFADTLIRKGERLGARGVLRNALSRNTMEGRTAFPLQARLIEVLAPGEDRSILAREFRRLRRLTGNDPDLFVAYFDLMRLQAPRLGWEPELLRELVADWADGEGALVAGATLLELALLRQDDGSVKSLWVKLLRRPDMNEPVMQRLALLFSRGSHPALATAALEWLARFNPLDSARMLDWARACFKGAGENRGDAAAAFQVLEELNVRSAFNSEVAGEVAKAYLEFGAIERARPLFEQVIAADPVARNFRAYLDFARLHVAERNFVRARQLLQSAFRNPLNRECQEIVELLAAEGLFDERFDEALAQFALDSQRQILTRQALFAFFEKNNAQAEALALVEAHPGMADAAICTRLRQLYKINFEKLAGLFERLRNMHGSVTVSSEELAAVYAGWAEADLNESKTEARLEHLRRANELLPGDFVIAQRLSEGLIGQGQARLAVAVLEKMIAASRVPADQARARVLLSTILH